MGNGEQYIWKPPEEDEIITLHPPPLRGENGQGHPSPPTAKEVVYKYVHVCVVAGSWQHCLTGTGIYRKTCRRTGLWFFLPVVFTNLDVHLIGRAVIMLLYCDPPAVQGFCLQRLCYITAAPPPNRLSELWPQSPCPQLLRLSASLYPYGHNVISPDWDIGYKLTWRQWLHPHLPPNP